MLIVVTRYSLKKNKTKKERDSQSLDHLSILQPFEEGDSVRMSLNQEPRQNHSSGSSIETGYGPNSEAI